MSEPISFAARKWANGNGSPGSHTVREMLEAAIAQIDLGELEVEHAILIWGREDDGVGKDGYMQAGPFSPYGQIGLLQRGLVLLTEGS